MRWGCLLFLELEAGLDEAGTVLQPRLQAGPEVRPGTTVLGERYFDQCTYLPVSKQAQNQTAAASCRQMLKAGQYVPSTWIPEWSAPT